MAFDQGIEMKRRHVQGSIYSEESCCSEDDLKDFDPEDADFGGLHDNTSSNRKKKTMGCEKMDDSRSHYRDFKVGRQSKVALPIDDKEFMYGKYAGKKIAKKELGFSREEKRAQEEQLLLNWSESEDHGDPDEQCPSVNENDQKLKEQLAALKEAEVAQLEILAKKSIDDVEKGRQVRQQLEKWQKSLDLRVRIQPLITLAQRVPDVETYSVLCKDEQVASLKENIEEHLQDICERIMATAEVFLDTGLLPDRSKISMEQRLNLLDKELSFVWRESLDGWHQKVSLITANSEIVKGKKQMKVINQSLWNQVEAAMRDRERLLKRAFTCRTGIQSIAGSSSRGRKVTVFDDLDFYSLLVRDWVAGNGTADAASAAGLIVNKIKIAQIKGVDPKASKGRKLRYDVQDKLVNYMVPINDGFRWPDEKIDAFFESIFVEEISSN